MRYKIRIAMEADAEKIALMKYPMNIMLLFMNMNKLLGKDLEESLNNLKSVLERKL